MNPLAIALLAMWLLIGCGGHVVNMHLLRRNHWEFIDIVMFIPAAVLGPITFLLVDLA